MIKSPLNECILLIAMCARTLIHIQQGNKQHRYVYNHAECDRHEWKHWLDNVLSLRLQTLAKDYPSLTDSSDPMLLFANFLAQASMVYLWKEIRSMKGLNDGSSDGRGGHQSLIAEYQQRAYAAVERIVELARLLNDFPFSKVCCWTRLQHSQPTHEMESITNVPHARSIPSPRFPCFSASSFSPELIQIP